METLLEIGKNDNAFDECSNLQSITFEGTTTPSCSSNALQNAQENIVINVPSGYDTNGKFCGRDVTFTTT